MLAFVRARLVLLSVPKTGTTALESALAARAELVLRARPEIKHLNLRQYHAHVAPILRMIPGPPFETVAVVRDPVDWLGSWYRYRSRDDLIGQPNSTARVGFDRFVEDYLSDDRPAYARIGRQSDFLAPPEGKPPVDHLFRYEAIAALAAFMADRTGKPVELRRSNVSPPADTTLPPEREARLRAALAPDQALWEGARPSWP